MKTGKVKFFNESKGYGFIETDESNNDLFFHVSDTQEEVTDGDEVTFDIEHGKRGPKAVDIKRS